MNYRYHLKKWSGKSSRLTCPSCGRPHCFSPYVDAEGKEVGKEYGRCDHENSCGYVKYPPSDYQYRERPMYRDFKPHQPSALRLSVERQVAQARKVVPVAAQSEDDICTIPFATIRPTIRFAPSSPLIAFLLTIFPESVVRQVISDYCLGTSKAGDTVYYQIDVQGRVRTGKVMKYDAATGHRVKDESVDGRVTWVHALLKAKKQLPADWELSQSLFGEHFSRTIPTRSWRSLRPRKPPSLGHAPSRSSSGCPSEASPSWAIRLRFLKAGGSSHFLISMPMMRGWRRSRSARTSTSRSLTSWYATLPPKTSPTATTSPTSSSGSSRTVMPRPFVMPGLTRHLIPPSCPTLPVMPGLTGHLKTKHLKSSPLYPPNIARNSPP